jgi:hypothetical protein
MILGIIPPEITTKEQLIVWAVAELRRDISANTPTPTFPDKITEAQGFFPNDIITIQELVTIDGGPRHILRIAMPVDPEYYGASSAVWNFAGLIRP